MKKVQHLWRDKTGGVLVEATVLITILFIFVLGAVDFLFAFYQWTAAAKAVQQGTRIAAVSDPVAVGLNGLSTAVVSSTILSGDPMPSFQVTCDGAAATCSCSGACTGVAGYDANAMNRIVSGRGCAQPVIYCAGMNTFLARVQPANVVVTYTQTGLGYAGRPGGPVPTVTVSLQNLPFQFFFLGDLLGFGNIAIPAMITPITGEDLSFSGT